MTVDAIWQADAAFRAADDAAHISTTASASHVATSGASKVFERFESDEHLKAWLLEAAVAEWGQLFGKPFYPWHLHANWADYIVGSGRPFFTASDDYSTTNVQVAGVDEADLVETDGEYLYLCNDGALVIIKAGIGDDLTVVSRIRLEDQPAGMYLDGNRLAIISSTIAGSGFDGGFRIVDVDRGFQEIEAHSPTTAVTVLDITDRAAPMLVQKIELDGRLLTSRTVDGQLRVVLSNAINLPRPIARGNNLQAAIALVPSSYLTFDDYALPPAGHVYETKEEYLSRVEDDILKALHPRVRQLDAHGNVIIESSLFDRDNLYRADTLFDRDVTTIATFDLMSFNSRPKRQASVFSGPVEVYSSTDHMYLFSPVQQSMSSRGVFDPKTDVWKLEFDARTHDVDLVARGRFDGRLLNQFAADEHNGYLRVVTTPRSGGHGVVILQQNGHRLQVVGSKTGIAANEQLYSVRFVGDRAFFVTFRVVDPLFAVDLSDPQNPQLLGELHVSGYSDYLQPIDENTLLAIGRDADERTGFFQDLQISMFDVSDMSDPQLLHRHEFAGGRSTETPATGNRWVRGDGDHHAVSYFPSERILALPVFFDGTIGSESAGGELQLFRVDPLNGFVPLGAIEHQSRVVRSVRIDDRLFAISSGMVSVHQLDNPELKLGMVDISSELRHYTVELAMSPFATLIELQPMHLMAISSTGKILPEPARWSWFSSVKRKANEPGIRAAILTTRFVDSRVDAALVKLLADELARSDESASNRLPTQYGGDVSGHDDEPNGLISGDVELSTRVSRDLLTL